MTRRLQSPPPSQLNLINDSQHPEASLKYVKISDQSELKNNSNLSSQLSPKRTIKTSQSSDSLVSLGDVELGVDDGLGESVEGVICDNVEGVDEVDDQSPTSRPVRMVCMHVI